MTTPWKPVNFNTESLSATKLQQVANNTQYLFDRAAKIRYQNSGITRETGVKILTGRLTVPPTPTATAMRQDVHFNNFFTAGCRPVVVTGYESSWARCQICIMGLGSAGVDHTGFRAYVTTDAYKNVNFTMRVHWIAIGY